MLISFADLYRQYRDLEDPIGMLMRPLQREEIGAASGSSASYQELLRHTEAVLEEMLDCSDYFFIKKVVNSKNYT